MQGMARKQCLISRQRHFYCDQYIKDLLLRIKTILLLKIIHTNTKALQQFTQFIKNVNLDGLGLDFLE